VSLEGSAINGVNALVTGGGTGVGRAVCLKLAKSGAAGIAVNYSSSVDDANETVQAIEALGCKALAVKADVGSDSSVDNMARNVFEEFGDISILVNSAGATRKIPIEDLDQVQSDDWEKAFNINLIGAFRCIKAFKDSLALKKGAVVNIASIAGHRGIGSSLPYGTSKAALIQMSRMLGRALAPDIRVNSVSPATMDTRWLRELLGNEAAEAFFKQEGESIPMRRVSTPEDVADAVVALLQCQMVTGTDLVVDGGKHLVY